jgi:hypothetical protein
MLVRGRLTDRQIEKYRKSGWYSAAFKAARREAMEKRDAIERLVRQFFGRRAIPAIEVGHQASAHFEIAFAVGVNAIVEPREESRECELRNCWFFS